VPQFDLIIRNGSVIDGRARRCFWPTSPCGTAALRGSACAAHLVIVVSEWGANKPMVVFGGRSPKGRLSVGIERVTHDVYRIGMGYVSAYLIAQDEVTVIDTGLPKHREIILEAASQARRKREDVKHILLTHHHADHTGSLAELMAATNAKAYIHPLDAAIIRGDKPAPGPNRDILAGRILGPLMARITPTLQPIKALEETNDGDEVPAAGGLKAIHTPGHTAGHLSFVWPQNGGVLFAGDAAGNVLSGPRPPVGALGGMFTEDVAAAKESFRRLAELEFEVACFGHGGPIKGKAHTAFRQKVEKLAK